MKLLLTIFVTFLFGTCLSLPRAQRNAVIKPPRAACASSQIIAVNLLKDSMEKEGNNVFSPLGISSILAILAEGSRGETYDEFKAALNYPEDRQQLRESFKEVLESLYQKNLSQTPSFRTWFYIYRNNTARDEFKQILHDYYLVDVKDVEMNKPLTRSDASSAPEVSSTTPANNSKDISDFEALKKSQSLDETPNVPEENKDASKFDQVVEDKQYVEVPVIKEEMAKEEMAKEEMAKEEMAKEEMAKEKMPKEDNPKEEMIKEEMIKEEMVKEEMPKEQMPLVIVKIDLPKEEMPKKEMMKEEMPKEEMMKEDMPEKEMPKEEMMMGDMPEKEMPKEEMMMEDMSKQEMAKEDMPKEEMQMKEKVEMIEEMPQKDMAEEIIILNKPEETIVMEIEKQKMPESEKITEEKPVSMEAEKSADLTIEKAADLNMEDNETVKDEEKLDILRKNTETAQSVGEKESNEPEKITIPLKKLEELEIMQALETHFVAKRFSEPRTLFQPDDVASGISANSVVSREKPSMTKMLIFNGLYYRGNWLHPFQELRSSEDDVFYVTPEKTVPVTMMRTRGSFRTAKLDDLNSRAIELPYEDNRYTLYVVVPNERDGLKNLIQKMSTEIFEAIPAQLSSSSISLCLPKFCSEQTNRAEDTLKRLGLKTIFTKSADLSALSDMRDLFVEGVVQHVNLKVDEGATRKNALTAVAQSRSAMEEPEEEKIVVDRPFLYYLVDTITNVVMVAGKVTEPKTVSSFEMDM